MSKPTFEEKAAPKTGAIREFVSYYKPHMRMFLLDMACATVISLVDILFPVFTRKVLYDFIPNQMMRTFVLMTILMLCCFLIRTAAQWTVTYLGHLMGVHIEADMRAAIFAHMQKLGFSFYDKNRTGLLMTRVTNDLFEITELAHHGPEDLFISIVTLTGAFIVLFTIQPVLALVLLASVPVIILFVVLRRKRMMSVSRAVKQRTAGINAEIESSISGIRVAKAFGNEREEIAKFTDCTGRYVEARRDYYKVMASFFAGTDLMMNLMSLSIIAVGSYLIMRSDMDIATLVTFNMYVASVQSPIRKLANFTEQFTQGMAGFQRFRAIMHESPDIVDAPDAKGIERVVGEIEFRDVTFTYDQEKEDVLEHVNLHIKPGRMLALVGPSGGGKSTLCQLIPRFYEVTEGSVLLDGQDIRSLKLADLRANIGIVQQDVFLFAGSILENIRYGKPTATMEEIIEAAKQAEIHEDIMRMPNGYDTIVGERGIMLSGGQKQRVSIARIFLKNPRVLILDEATSALDTATERKIQAAFDRLARGRTTLVIAHRLSTIKNADEIVVISEHGILERGTHAELVRAGGLYADLAQGAALAGE